MGTWRVAFPGTAFPPAELPDMASLSELLTVQNCAVAVRLPQRVVRYVPD